MKFIIITEYGADTIEAEDWEQAMSDAYNNHNGYDNLISIVKIPDEDD